jgi:hypothetical protein
MDFSFTGDEDFGLAKSFSSAPILSIAPLTNFDQRSAHNVESEYSDANSNQVITDGFCFKFAPGVDVRISILNQLFDNPNHFCNRTLNSKDH